MPNWTWLVLHFLHTMALGLWVGGMVAIGGLAAPAIFGLAASRSEAGRIMSRILQRFDTLVMVCIGFLAGTSLIMVALYGRMSPWYAIEYVCIAMMSASALYSAYVVSPRIRALRAAGHVDNPEFDRLHRTSVLAMQFNLACGTVALFFS